MTNRNSTTTPRSDPAELLALLQRLVQIPSHPGIERQEEAVALALAEWLEARGIACRLVEVLPGRPNLLASVGDDAGPHLVLCGHTDTVPLNVDDAGFGFSGEVVDGRLRGRGSADMKGAVAAMAATLATLARSGLTGGRVTLAAVMDEEMGGLGAEHLVGSGFAADGMVIGEPTENRLCLGHKGLEWLTIELLGRAAHGGTPERGVNAIDAMACFASLVDQELRPRFERLRHWLLGPPTINFGTIEGGDQPSTVAGSCRLTVDRRLVLGESFSSAVGELEELVSAVRDRHPEVTGSVRRCPGGMTTLEHRPFVTVEDDPLVVAAVAAFREERGEEPVFGAFPAWTDGGFFAVQGGIPTIIQGPGELSIAHTPWEEIALSEVEEAARLYLDTARRFCGRGAI